MTAITNLRIEFEERIEDLLLEFTQKKLPAAEIALAMDSFSEAIYEQIYEEFDDSLVSEADHVHSYMLDMDKFKNHESRVDSVSEGK